MSQEIYKHYSRYTCTWSVAYIQSMAREVKEIHDLLLIGQNKCIKAKQKNLENRSKII